MAAADIALHHLLTIRLESISEQNQFLDSLAKSIKFQKLVRRFYPSNQEFGTSELIGLIIAARKDSSGLLRYDACYSSVSSPVYSRRLPFIWLQVKNEDRLASRLLRLIRELYEIANPGQKIRDAEWAVRDFNEHCFEGNMVLFLEVFPRRGSKPQIEHMLLAYVRMGTTSNKIVDLEVYYETHASDHSGPILGGNSRITETGIAAPCILPAASMVKTCPMVRQNAFAASGAQDTKLKVCDNFESKVRFCW